MNILDAFLLVPIAYAAYTGFVNGIVREVFTLAGMLAGFLLVLIYVDEVSAAIQSFFSLTEQIAKIAASVIIFVGTVSVFQAAAILLKKFLQWVQLNAVNRLLGSLFSILKTATILSALLFILNFANLPKLEHREDSVSFSYIQPLAPALFTFFTLWNEDWKDTFNSFRKQVESRLPAAPGSATV